MRIVAGEWRGRRIRPPQDDRVRPTGDRVREAWMSIVNSHLPDAAVLDLFAGSGALGLEALSRGAAHADFVEISARSIRAINENATSLGADPASFAVHRGDALRFIQKLGANAYDVAFADPPYRMGFAEKVADQWLDVPFSAMLGVEHAADEAMPAGGDMRRYGDTAITFYSSE